MTETERAGEFLAQKAKRAVITTLFVVALVASVGVNVLVAWQFQHRAENATQTAVTFAQQVQEACADGGLLVDGRDLCPQADAIIEDPVAPPVDPLPQDGTDGDDAPGPTNAQVEAAVDRWCETEGPCATPPTMAQVARAVADLCDGGCDGKDGEDGEDGDDAPPPDPAELQALVMQTVLTYCDAGPQCDKGDTGAAGRDAPSLEEVRAMVTTVLEEHCAAQPGGTCEGDQGKTGDTGPAGVSIATVKCPEPADDWLIEFTDGTTQTVPGPCRVDPITEPTPPTPDQGATP
jgi:hypothetical protein